MVISYDENVISDLHKDAYGFRPDGSFWGMWAAFNPTQKQALWDSMLADLDRSIEREEEEYQAAMSLFEDRIDNLMHDGTNRRAIAQWLIAAEEDCDDEGFEFINGLPFGYLKKMGYV
jgi:hypothetical protein